MMSGLRALAAWGVLMSIVVVSRGAAPPPASKENLELQVAALTKLHEFELTAEQLRALEKLAGQVTPDKPALPEKMNAAHRTALTNVRDAMIDGDETKVVEAQEKLDDLRDERNLESQTEVKMTDSARKLGPSALNVLSTTQIAGYLALHSDDVPDALQTMLDAIDESRGMGDADYAALKSEAASQVGLLVAGLNQTAEDAVGKRVGEWLDRAKAMSDAEVKTKRPQLEASARQIIGRADPILELRHWLEREMADLLSNPELTPMLAAKLK